MARIRISDLSKDVVITEEDMRRLKGGPNRRAHDDIGGSFIKIECTPAIGNVALSEPALIDPYIKWD